MSPKWHDLSDWHSREASGARSALGRMDRRFDAVLDEPVVSSRGPSRPFHDEMELLSARDLDLGARRRDEASSHKAIIRDWLCRIDVESTFETLDKNGAALMQRHTGHVHADAARRRGQAGILVWAHAPYACTLGVLPDRRGHTHWHQTVSLLCASMRRQ